MTDSTGVPREVVIAEGYTDRALFCLRTATSPGDVARAHTWLSEAAAALELHLDRLEGVALTPEAHVLLTLDESEPEWDEVALHPKAKDRFRCPALNVSLTKQDCLRNAIQGDEPCSCDCSVAVANAQELGIDQLTALAVVPQAEQGSDLPF